MRILHLGQYYPPYPGGIESYSKIFCEGLISEGVDVDIVVSNDKPYYLKEEINGVKIYRLPRRGLLSSRPICPTMPKIVNDLLKQNNYSAVHLHFPNIMSDVSYFLSSIFSKHKLIISYHADLISDRKEAYFINILKIVYGKTMVPYLFNKAKFLVFSSKNYANNRKNAQKFKDKMAIIPIPVNPNYFLMKHKNEVNLLKQRFGDFILFVGNFVDYKGIEYLIRAMKDIKANLVLIGSGNIESKLKKITIEEKISQKVNFVGSIVRENGLKNYYDACKIFCLPSCEEHESFGIVLLEAMACGKAIISTDINTGTSWVNQNNETGLVVKPKSSEALSEAINYIFKNDDVRLRMEVNARNRVLEYFTIDKVIKSLMDLYKN